MILMNEMNVRTIIIMFVILIVYLHFTASCIQKFTDNEKESMKNRDRLRLEERLHLKML